jgi:ferritin-like metal-binding protein YciE
MAEKDLGELFLHTLKDVYFAEHEILKTLRKWPRRRRMAA